MAGSVVRVPLADGGSLLVRVAEIEEAAGEAAPSGPVRAGRVSDRVGALVQEATWTLSETLEPVVGMAQQVLDQLARARPQELQVEFGLQLTAEAGAMLATAGAGCHLTVTMTWAADKSSAVSEVSEVSEVGEVGDG